MKKINLYGPTFVEILPLEIKRELTKKPTEKFSKLELFLPNHRVSFPVLGKECFNDMPYISLYPSTEDWYKVNNSKMQPEPEWHPIRDMNEAQLTLLMEMQRINKCIHDEIAIDEAMMQNGNTSTRSIEM